MPLQCHCGSTEFKPIGIQESWPGRETDNAPRVLFLVNCLKCGTTKSCNRLDYALMKNEEITQVLDDSFYSVE